MQTYEEKVQETKLEEMLTDVDAETPAAKRPSRKRWIVAAAAGLGLLVTAGAGWRMFAKPAAPTYSEVTLKKGTVAQTIHATGKVQAVTTVQVGSQVSGTVSELHADFNDKVKAGQLVARLDPSQLEAQLSQVKAALLSSQANERGAKSGVDVADASVRAAQANVDRAQSVVDDAQKTSDRAQALLKEGAIPRQDVDKASAALVQAQSSKQQAVAQLQQSMAQAVSAKAQWDQAKSGVSQSQSALEVAEVNLQRTFIKSPIDGVVISRSVDVGQTVAASLQAPVLFLIANDLTKMQVLADVDEADVGGLVKGSKVTFTVDAFPNDTFEGRISQVRLAPQTVQNVTTYTAVVDVNNPESKLKPGMTANITATIAQKDDVLLVPNAALRFRPDGAAQSNRGSMVFKVADGKLTPARVKLGLSDGLVSEVVSGSIAAGDHVAVAAAQQTKTGTGSKSGPAFPGTQVRTGGRR